MRPNRTGYRSPALGERICATTRGAAARDPSSVGGCARYAPGVTPWTASTSRPAPRASSSSSRAVKQVVQRSNCAPCRRVAHGRPLVQHAGGGIVRLARLEVSHREGGREGADRQPTAGPDRGRDPAEHLGLVAAAEQPEAALAQADRGVELPRRRRGRARRARGTAAARPSASAAAPGQATNSARGRRPTTSNPAPGERERVATRPAAHVEDAHPRLRARARRRGSRPPARCPW